ncbi:MAG: hypothetical protein J7M38_02510 [Armatimonadetes bacterium]|nr:hypothetical protein [Armatimonadota bacterium]
MTPLTKRVERETSLVLAGRTVIVGLRPPDRLYVRLKGLRSAEGEQEIDAVSLLQRSADKTLEGGADEGNDW